MDERNPETLILPETCRPLLKDQPSLVKRTDSVIRIVYPHRFITERKTALRRHMDMTYINPDVIRNPYYVPNEEFDITFRCERAREKEDSLQGDMKIDVEHVKDAISEEETEYIPSTGSQSSSSSEVENLEYSPNQSDSYVY